ncbi:MAG: hypothetical protein JXA54_17345 [Candidatus Heimdallarchaeota archaeon]|nr:hypothetical protein [Candidatus Heimdallarchaeota archaeon]
MSEDTDMCEIINQMKVTITTSNKRGSGTDDPIKLYVGDYAWDLDHPFCDDFEKGRTDEFELDIPKGMTSDWFQYFCLKKEHTIRSDNWILSRVVVEINNRIIYDTGEIEFNFSGGKNTWCARDFFYGKCRGNVSPDFNVKY